MGKYIRVMIQISYSLLRFCFIKLLCLKDISFTVLNLVSPLTSIQIDKKGSLILKKYVRMRSGTKLIIRKNATIEIGENTFINHNCILTAHQRITIGKNVQIGPNVLIYDHDHDYKNKNVPNPYVTTAVDIGNNVWIGANVVILRGTKIGDNSVVGAGSVIRGVYPKNVTIVQKRHTSVYTHKR